MVVESWIMGKLLDFNHQSLTLRFMEAAKSGDMNAGAVDMTLTHSNRELLERWLIQIEKGRGKLVEILLRKLPLTMAERFLLQLERDRDDVVEAALAGGTIERYLDQMEGGNTQVTKIELSKNRILEKNWTISSYFVLLNFIKKSASWPEQKFNDHLEVNLKP